MPLYLAKRGRVRFAGNWYYRTLCEIKRRTSMEKVRYMISDAASLVDVESHVLRYWEDELELDIPRNEE